MFTDSEILKKIIEEPVLVFPEAKQVFVKTISKDDVPIIPLNPISDIEPTFKPIIIDFI